MSKRKMQAFNQGGQTMIPVSEVKAWVQSVLDDPIEFVKESTDSNLNPKQFRERLEALLNL